MNHGNERRILWTACASHSMVHVYELAVPALLLPIQTEFASGDLSLGRVVTIYSLLFGLGALPAGYLVDRMGSKLLLVVCIGGAALATAGMAASPSLTVFGLCAAAMGLCLSTYHPAGTAMLTHALPVEGRTFAVHGMMGNLGVAAASVIAGTLGAVLGWRWALGVLAAAGFVLVGFIRRLPAPAPQEIRSRPGTGRWGLFALLLVAMFFLGTVYRGLTTFLPKFLSTSYAAGTALGGLLTTLALLVGLGGMYVAGRMLDRRSSAATVFMVGAVCQAPFMIALGFAGVAWLVPLAMGFAFFHFFTQPPGNYMVAELTPPALRGLGYGIYFFVAFGLGSWGATLGGWVSERTALADAFPILALLLLPVIVSIAAIRLRLGAVRPRSG